MAKYRIKARLGHPNSSYRRGGIDFNTVNAVEVEDPTEEILNDPRLVIERIAESGRASTRQSSSKSED